MNKDNDKTDLVSLKGLSANLEYLLVENINLTDSTFFELNQLKRLHIRLNDFSNISNDAFNRLNYLEYLLIFDSNNLSHITFSGKPHLKFLLLSGLNNSSFQPDISLIPSLSVFSIKNIFTKSISNEYLGSLKHSNLKTLNLDYCNLPHFDTSFLAGLTALQTFTAKACEIESIRFSENLSNLNTLVLKKNNFKTLDSTISLLKGLKILVLSSNSRLKSSPNMFMGLDNLESLKLSKCDSLSRIHRKMFNGLHNLLDLDMSDCELTSIHLQTFYHTPKLIKLNLSNNNLNLKNTNAVHNLIHLKELNLSNNKIEYFNIEESMFENLVSLEVLDLTKNGIGAIEINLLEYLKKLRVLTI